MISSKLPSLKLTQPLKIGGWQTTFLLGRPVFNGYVSFREDSLDLPKLVLFERASVFWHAKHPYVSPPEEREDPGTHSFASCIYI